MTSLVINSVQKMVDCSPVLQKHLNVGDGEFRRMAFVISLLVATGTYHESVLLILSGSKT